MPGPVFIHYQTYSTKPNAAGNSVAQVIAEALRRGEYVRHVADPQPPRIIHGDAEAFEQTHADHVAERATEVKRKGKTHRRAIRADRHTLATVVASYPLTHEQIAAGGDEARAHHAAWERDTIAWVRDRHGDQLKVVIAHDDESHSHIHFWLLPDDVEARADTLHPGKVAKRIAEDVARASGASDRDAVKAGNDALKIAMRETLDAYHREVGEPLGMTRDGPKRRRLTRAQWQAEKAEAVRLAAALRRAEGAEAQAAKIIKDAETQAAAVVASAEAEKVQAVADAKEAFTKQAKAWVIRTKADLNAQQLQTVKILDGMKATFKRFKESFPAVRKVLQFSEATPAMLENARAQRREIVQVAPMMRRMVKEKVAEVAALHVSAVPEEQTRPETLSSSGPGF